MGGEIGSPGNHEKTEYLRDYGKFTLGRGGGKVLLSSLPFPVFPSDFIQLLLNSFLSLTPLAFSF